MLEQRLSFVVRRRVSMNRKRNQRWNLAKGSTGWRKKKTLIFVDLFVFFFFRAKCIKNSVTVNEELTAEEWKRRWEREREKVARLKGQLSRAELELERWRQGSNENDENGKIFRFDFRRNGDKRRTNKFQWDWWNIIQYPIDYVSIDCRSSCARFALGVFGNAFNDQFGWMGKRTSSSFSTIRWKSLSRDLKIDRISFVVFLFSGWRN